MMNSTQYYTASQLADEQSAEVLIHALAIIAVRDTQQMLGDFVKDPAYVATEGIPTRDVFVQTAVTYMSEAIPVMLLDEMEVITPEVDGEPLFVAMCRQAVAGVIRQYPQLRRISIDL